MKAMILAAGYGSRMSPLTHHTAKALLPLRGKPLLTHLLEKLSQLNIREVVINTHHCAKQFFRLLEKKKTFDMPIRYLYEPSLLGTGGGIYNALPWLGEDAFLLLNGDIWTNYPLAKLITKKPKYAHLLLVPNPTSYPQGDFDLDQKGTVLATTHAPHTYGNIAMLHPRLFINAPALPFNLGTLLRHFAQQQLITGEVYEGPWFNINNPLDYRWLKLNIETKYKELLP